MAATVVHGSVILYDRSAAATSRLIGPSSIPLGIAYLAVAPVIGHYVWRKWLSGIKVSLHISLRTLMIIVPSVGIPLGLVLERQSRFSREADYHQAEVVSGISATNLCYKRGGGETIFTDSKGEWISADRARRLLAMNVWHQDLAAKYRTAARYPWRPVEPDPRPPE